MQLRGRNFRIPHWWHWIVGFVAVLWLLLRSGTNPRRLTYPCQRAAMPIATNWILAMIAFFSGSLLLRRFAKLAAAPILIVGVIWFVGALPELSNSGPGDIKSLPVWEVEDPISTVFVMDSIPPTTGSLAPGDTTVPDEYLPDPAIDTLLAMLETKGVFLHETSLHPDGIVDSDEIVILKGNFQWTGRNTTSTDRIKGVIWQVLQHPEGFSGEIIVCDNTQEIGTGINEGDNNSEDPEQSIIDVVNTFYSKGYPVYCLDWNFVWDVVAWEYSQGDYNDGYVYETATKISYPKFRSPSGDYYISLRYGIWDSVSAVYDSSRLCVIDFPVLKAHSMAGATIAVKNWIGMLTTAYADERYGGRSYMHYTYFFGTYALVARIMAVTFPQLTIVDATWTTTRGPVGPGWVEETKMLVASTDPVAASWYGAKFILTPIAYDPGNTNPDLPGSRYNTYLGNWTTFLSDSAGFPCTKDSSEISVYDRGVLLPIWIEMIPDNPPVVVPRGGGFGFSGILRSNSEEPQVTDVWTMAIGPEKEAYGPFKEFHDLQLAPYETRSGHFDQRVPNLAPLGFYDYIAYCGEYPSTVIDSSFFELEVIAGPSTGAGEAGWVLTGSFSGEDLVDLPSEFALLSNYPNPFNAQTVIEYQLPVTSSVKLEIFNVLGNKVATLADGEQEAGYTSVTWDASEVSSGLYFYKLTAGDFTETRRMMLVK